MWLGVRCYKTSFSSGLCRPVQFRNWTSSARYSIKERRHCSMRLAAEGKWSFCKIVKLRSFCCGHLLFEAAAAQGPATRQHCTVRCWTFLFKFFYLSTFHSFCKNIIVHWYWSCVHNPHLTCDTWHSHRTSTKVFTHHSLCSVRN